jgi:exosortase E/protease (VPEID-CTERM system)
LTFAAEDPVGEPAPAVTARNGLFSPGRRMSLNARVATAAAALLAEKFFLNFFVDFDSAQAANGLGAAVRIAQHWGFRFLVTLAISLALFIYVQGRERWTEIESIASREPLRPKWLLLHVALLPVLAVLAFFLYGTHEVAVPFSLVLTSWLVVALVAVAALFAGLAPWALWLGGAEKVGMLWLYAVVVAAVAASAMQWSQLLWTGMARVTFEAVRYILTPLIPTLAADPSTRVIDSGQFAVEISDICSGLEGMGLMLAFCSAWLLLFRKEYIFPRALLLIPAGLLLIVVLNVVRIALLVLIGHVGFGPVAIYGFHSQAGWIAFNCAAGFIAYASRKSPALNRNARHQASAAENPTATYLVPFLAILAAGMLATALSSGFETLYVLRPVAAGLALYRYWPRLRRLQWRVTWRGPAVGFVVFVVWIIGARLRPGPDPMPLELSVMPAALSLTWIAIRAIASATIVPLAEELAFRGFLMRRLVAADFQAVPYRSVGLGALLMSALAFGLSHGAMWFPGSVAGLLYGWVTLRSGSLGEAVAAHATTNGLLAGLVVLAGKWQLWS